ncbi:MAG: hypothetical protein VW474_12210, partial [Paracoccaceae bacterium]
AAFTPVSAGIGMSILCDIPDVCVPSEDVTVIGSMDRDADIASMAISDTGIFMRPKKSISIEWLRE